jgi:hypothetical protein
MPTCRLLKYLFYFYFILISLGSDSHKISLNASCPIGKVVVDLAVAASGLDGTE